MKHIMCVRLKQWSIDRFKRRRALPDPLVLVQTSGLKQMVAVACSVAQSQGIMPGMTLAQARALCPALMRADYEPVKDCRGLEALARWMFRFSPTVAIELPDAILLDVSGSERLFGSWEKLLALASKAVGRLGLHHGIAIAPTVGGAWAWASYGNVPSVIAKEELQDALASLPVVALRLDIQVAKAFQELGIERIQQLSDLPREVLPARFGAAVLRRLDEARGLIDEPLAPIAYREPIDAQIEVETAITSLETILEVLKLLIDQIIHQLRRRMCGVRKLVAEFSSPYAPPVQQTVDLSRPTCDAKILLNLLRCATEHLTSVDGFNRIRLSITVSEPLSMSLQNVFLT